MQKLKSCSLIAVTFVCFASAAYAAQVNIVFAPGTCSAECDRILLRCGGVQLGAVNGLNVVTAFLPDAGAWEALKNIPGVLLVEADGIANASAMSRASNGRGQPAPQPPPQPSQTVPTGVARINAAPSLSTNTGAGVIVAMIDTGIDFTHPDLVNNLLRDSKGNIISYVTVPRVSSAQDDNGHGTHVSGTVAATNNTIGVVGVAPGASLMAIKALDRTGSGSYSGIASGITWAADHGAKVISMSLGGTASSSTLQNAVIYAANKGVQIVCAAGNDGPPKPPATSTVEYPAKYVQCIAVSAWVDTDGKPGGLGTSTGYGADDTLATFSSTGPEVDIAAPGVNIRSTWPSSSYNTISGTSMATPHVSGVMARIIATGATDPRATLTTSYVETLSGYTASQVGAGLVHAAP